MLYYFILYYILHLFYYSFAIYLKVPMIRLDCRGLNCSNYTILGESLVRGADGRGGNTIQGLFTFDLYIL